jgi:hypothetical protein
MFKNSLALLALMLMDGPADAKRIHVRNDIDTPTHEQALAKKFDDPARIEAEARAKAAAPPQAPAVPTCIAGCTNRRPSN